jgi:ABC-2 type transport system permease protein
MHNNAVQTGYDHHPAARLFVHVAQAWAFVKKDAGIAVGYRLQFIFQFSQVFFSVAIIYFIGEMIEKTGGSSLLKVYGSDYFSFALVGLAVTGFLRAGLVTITNDIRQVMNQGTFEAMCATPIGYTWLLLCSSLWPFLFESVRVVFYFLVGIVIFGLRFDRANWNAAALTMALTIPIFLMLGITSSSILILVKRGDPINWIFSGAASLLAGAMFPIAVMPSWLRAIAMCLPLTHSLEAMRRTVLTGASARQIIANLAALFLFAGILLMLTLFVNILCMKRAKASGAFTTH